MILKEMLAPCLEDGGQIVVVEVLLVLVDDLEEDGLGGNVRELVVEADLVVTQILKYVLLI